MNMAVDDPIVGAGCEIARDGDVLAAYAAGRLREPEAEAFEQHYFPCEECWQLVRTATAVRSAKAGGPAEPTTPADARGAAKAMSLEVVVDGPAVRTSWTPVTGAAGYELRLYDAGGRLVGASRVAPTTLAVDLVALSQGGALNVAALDIVALDGVGHVLLRSERVPLER
jgi:hypothetical protein